MGVRRYGRILSAPPRPPTQYETAGLPPLGRPAADLRAVPACRLDGRLSRGRTRHLLRNAPLARSSRRVAIIVSGSGLGPPSSNAIRSAVLGDVPRCSSRGCRGSSPTPSWLLQWAVTKKRRKSAVNMRDPDRAVEVMDLARQKVGFAQFVAIYLGEYRSGMVFTTSFALGPLGLALLAWLIDGRADTDLLRFAMVFSPAVLLLLVLLWGMAIPGLRRRIEATREILRTLSVADVLLGVDDPKYGAFLFFATGYLSEKSTVFQPYFEEFFSVERIQLDGAREHLWVRYRTGSRSYHSLWLEWPYAHRPAASDRALDRLRAAVEKEKRRFREGREGSGKGEVRQA